MRIKSNCAQTFITIVICSFANFACHRPPDEVDNKNVKGYVIGHEICHADEADDYWLVDLTYLPNPPRYGDTIVLNGTTYTNVIKTKGLDPRLEKVGTKVSLDYTTITANKVGSAGCSVDVPITYNLEELFILNQGIIQ